MVQSVYKSLATSYRIWYRFLTKKAGVGVDVKKLNMKSNYEEGDEHKGVTWWSVAPSLELDHFRLVTI